MSENLVENASGKPVICPECRQLSIFRDDGKHNYSFKAFPAAEINLKREFTHSDKILISEFHDNHYFIILLEKESADDNIQIEGKVASTFNLHVKTIVQKINEKALGSSKYGILILSDQSLWGQLINIVYASLIQSNNLQINKSKLTTSNLRSLFEYENLRISHNSEEETEMKYNAVIVDQKNLIYEQNMTQLIQKLEPKGSFVITVNSRTEDPIPKISMKEFNDQIKQLKLNFLFVDVQDIQQAAILLTQVLQKK